MIVYPGTLLNGGSAFRGVLDVVSGATAAYSTRLLRRSYTGSCVNIRRSSDNAQRDFGFAGGALDTAGVSAFIGAGSGFVTKWYDQSGLGNDASQTTAALQPSLAASTSFGGKPVITWSAHVLNAADNAGIKLNADSSCAAVVRPTTAASTQMLFGKQNGVSAIIYFLLSTSLKPEIDRPGGASGTAGAAGLTSGSIAQMSYTLGSANLAFFLNGVANGTSTLANGTATTDPLSIGAENVSAGQPFIGDMPELIIFNTALSAANRALIDANQKGFWGTP